MDQEIKCYSTQFIEGGGAFRAHKLDNFINQVKLGECGLSYAIVAIIGPQSSGKSTLLNHLFHTNFREMDADDGRCQTTRGIWIARCVAIDEPRTIVIDIEGTDGSERGEDDIAFEKQSALFSLAISDIVLINMWCNSIGLENASNKPLLRTVFMAMLRLFSPRKTTLMFVIRDKSKTPIEKLASDLKKDIQKIWDGIPKPEAHKHTPLSDVFNIEVVGLVSYEFQEEQFRQQVDSLREKFFQSIAPGGLAGDREVYVPVPGSDFSFSAQQIWKDIKADKDLELPAYKVMVATIRCPQIADELYSSFVKNKDWLKLDDAIQSPHVQDGANEDWEAVQSHLVPGYGETLISLRNKCLSWLNRCLSNYDDATSHYEISVSLASKNQLKEKLMQVVQPPYQSLLEHLKSVALKNFKTALDHALNGGQGFAMAARECTDKFTRLFDEQYASIKIADWDSADIGVRFSSDMFSHVTDVRTSKLSELTTQYELKLKEALYGRVGAFLKGGRGDAWPEIRKHYNCETQKVEFGFSFALSGFEMDEHDKANMISELMNYARGQVEQVTKEIAKNVLHIMKDRFTSILNHDKHLRPRLWTVGEYIQDIKRTAQTSSLKVLSVLAAIRLDDKDTDTIYDMLVHTLLDEPREKSTIYLNPLGSSKWEKISATETTITPHECKSLWVQFLGETAYIAEAKAIQLETNRLNQELEEKNKRFREAKEEKKRRSKNRKTKIRNGFKQAALVSVAATTLTATAAATVVSGGTAATMIPAAALIVARCFMAMPEKVT